MGLLGSNRSPCCSSSVRMRGGSLTEIWYMCLLVSLSRFPIAQSMWENRLVQMEISCEPCLLLYFLRTDWKNDLISQCRSHTGASRTLLLISSSWEGLYRLDPKFKAMDPVTRWTPKQVVDWMRGEFKICISCIICMLVVVLNGLSLSR